jgi:hypothetical protein
MLSGASKLYHPQAGDDTADVSLHPETDANTPGISNQDTSMTLRTYEITFAGEAVPAIIGAFEDFDVQVGNGSTTLRATLIDQPALHGVIDRLQSLGLDLLEVRCG